MYTEFLVGLCTAMVSLLMLHRALAPARAVLHGQAARVPDIPRMLPLRAPAYVAFLCWWVPL